MSLLSQRTSSENDGTIIVVGGGPVGLYYIAQQAHNARNASPSKVYNIHLYEARIKQGSGGHFVWKEEADNNNRRRQIVTIQSNVWTKWDQGIQDAIFTEGNFFEMWPLGPDSPKR